MANGRLERKKEGQDSFIDSWYKNEHFVWHNGYGPAVATNFMEQYQQDVDLMKSIHLTHYRTSINWARFFTDYENCIVDEEYAQHISEMIDSLIEADVEPMICLEHYEVPAFLLEKYDGWSSRKVVDFYAKYAKIAFDRYGDRVKTGLHSTNQSFPKRVAIWMLFAGRMNKTQKNG